jgi:hypothetical protein
MCRRCPPTASTVAETPLMIGPKSPTTTLARAGLVIRAALSTATGMPRKLFTAALGSAALCILQCVSELGRRQYLNLG